MFPHPATTGGLFWAGQDRHGPSVSDGMVSRRKTAPNPALTLEVRSGREISPSLDVTHGAAIVAMYAGHRARSGRRVDFQSDTAKGPCPGRAVASGDVGWSAGPV